MNTNFSSLLKSLAWVALLFPTVASSAIITPLFAPSGLTLVNDFESTINNSQSTWDTTAELALASTWTEGGTPSGVQGLLEFLPNGPLEALLPSSAFQVGLWFGNDANPAGSPINLGIVYAHLEVFEDAHSLGSVTVFSNRNEFADQFIGLSSDVAFDRVAISYLRPQARQLAVFVDDFYLGDQPTMNVAVPSPVALILTALALLARVSKPRDA